MSRPIFIISLDFELHWGRFDKASVAGNESYYRQAREAVPRILELFETYEIEATWATVGMLFAADLEEWQAYSPVQQPTYQNNAFSPYKWLEKNKVQDEFLFAPELINRILHTEGQEVGSHTFSHYYTLEKGQTEGQFRQDLEAAQRIAGDKFGIRLSSLVFPRNQFNRRYMGISREMGFTAVRSNPADWYWNNTSNETLMKKAFRTADVFLPVGRSSSFSLSASEWREDMPLEIPASRFLRPYSDIGILNRLKAVRIKEEMSASAKEAKMYHLWWHPHNHGHRLEESIDFLRVILQHFRQLKEHHGMISCNMASVERLVKLRALDTA